MSGSWLPWVVLGGLAAWLLWLALVTWAALAYFKLKQLERDYETRSDLVQQQLRALQLPSPCNPIPPPTPPTTSA